MDLGHAPAGGQKALAPPLEKHDKKALQLTTHCTLSSFPCTASQRFGDEARRRRRVPSTARTPSPPPSLPRNRNQRPRGRDDANEEERDSHWASSASIFRPATTPPSNSRHTRPTVPDSVLKLDGPFSTLDDIRRSLSSRLSCPSRRVVLVCRPSTRACSGAATGG